VAYAVIDGDSFNVLNGPKSLDNPGDRRGGFVSVTHDETGHGILTWMDANWNGYLYYALVASNGGLVTPPMMFHSGQGVNQFISTSDAGQGNAVYDPSLYLHLPMVVNK